jgi:hypothetical protein
VSPLGAILQPYIGLTYAMISATRVPAVAFGQNRYLVAWYDNRRTQTSTAAESLRRAVWSISSAGSRSRRDRTSRSGRQLPLGAESSS